MKGQQAGLIVTAGLRSCTRLQPSLPLLLCALRTPPLPQVRLLMCYSATHLEKLDGTREAQWQKVARLTSGDMACVTNLEYLGVPGEGVGGCWHVGGREHCWVGLVVGLLWGVRLRTAAGIAHSSSPPCIASHRASTGSLHPTRHRSAQACQGRRHHLWAQAAACGACARLGLGHSSIGACIVEC